MCCNNSLGHWVTTGSHLLVLVPGQPSPPFRLLGISINCCRGDVLFKPIQLGYEILNFLPDVLGVLQMFASVVRDDDPLNSYLIMPNERAYTTEGRLKGREPIGGLFRNIQEYLRTIRNPLPLRCETSGVKSVNDTV